MPLSQPVQREQLHLRDIQVWGYHRTDGLYDIEGHLTDTKPFPIGDDDRGKLPPGAPLHEMWMRLTIDERMTIVGAEACTDHGPYFSCPGGATSYAKLVGLTIKPGFLRAANERIGGPVGCTHIREMLQQMATTAFQAMWPVRAQGAAARPRSPKTATPRYSTPASPTPATARWCSAAGRIATPASRRRRAPAAADRTASPASRPAARRGRRRGGHPRWRRRENNSARTPVRRWCARPDGRAARRALPFPRAFASRAGRYPPAHPIARARAACWCGHAAP